MLTHLQQSSEIAEALSRATGFTEFVEGSISGLRRIAGRNIDVLAVASDAPGRGLLSLWLADLMARYSRIRFLHVENPLLSQALERRGFVRVEWFEDGECVSGMRRSAP